MQRYIIILAIVGISSAAVLITNGDFEEPLETGWFQDSSGSGLMTILRETYYDPDPDYEVLVHKGDGTGIIKLFQTVVIPTTDLEFSVNAKLSVFGTSVDCWAGAGVCISYLNASNVVLGSSKICARTVACPWHNNDSCHIIDAIDTLWNNYTFNIDDELVNLPAVNGSDVAKIRVSLLAQCVDECGHTEWAKVFADDIALNTGVEEITKYDVITPKISLYPNPFSCKIDIRWQAVNNSEVNLKIYDTTGRLVKQFNHSTIQLFNQVTWDAKDNSGMSVSSGVYFVKFKAGDYSVTEKLLLIR